MHFFTTRSSRHQERSPKRMRGGVFEQPVRSAFGPTATRTAEMKVLGFVQAPQAVRQKLRSTCTGNLSQCTARNIPRCALSQHPVILPAWERRNVKERGLAGTSYEAATVEHVRSVGEGLLDISVDTSATCTCNTYVSVGQFLFLKPWGDEDGSLQPCCFTRRPSADPVFSFFVPETSAVGEAAMAGEMLEVSDVMGEGFSANHLSNRAYLEASHVVGVCTNQFCTSVLLSVEDEQRSVTMFVRGDPDGHFSELLESWKRKGSNRRAKFFADNESLVRALDDQFGGDPKVAMLLGGDYDICAKVHGMIKGFGSRWQPLMIAP